MCLNLLEYFIYIQKKLWLIHVNMHYEILQNIVLFVFLNKKRRPTAAFTWKKAQENDEEESRKCIFFEMQLIRNRVSSCLSLHMKESLIKIANFDFSSRTICTALYPPYCKQTNKQFTWSTLENFHISIRLKINASLLNLASILVCDFFWQKKSVPVNKESFVDTKKKELLLLDTKLLVIFPLEVRRCDQVTIKE